MSRAKVAILDYGLGNLYSIHRALQHLGVSSFFCSDPHELGSASHLILPGVGAFGDGMEGLKNRGLLQAIHEYAARGRAILGICLGMQLLLGVSEEFGLHEGIGLIPGRVIRFPEPTPGRDHYKIPHIGWCELWKKDLDWSGTILEGVDDGESAYFVHSYRAALDDKKNYLACTRYAGIEYPSVIRSGAVYGTQFHPEKSGESGIRMLKNFTNL